MRTVADLRAWAARQWARNWREWAAMPESTGPPSWPLHPPTQRELAADPDAVALAVGQWRQLEGEDGVTLEWVERTLPSFGRQRLPSRAHLSGPAVARLLGESEAWERATAALAHLRHAWPVLEQHPAATRAVKALATLPEEDLVRLMAVLGWLEANPETVRWERELPVPGVDTKWVERHRTLVGELAHAITGSLPGLRRIGARFTVHLPPEADGVRQFSVDLEGLRGLGLRPQRVLIVENVVSLLSLPDLSGTVAIHGMGFAAPTLARVAWVAAAEQLYWGDLDTYGFQILGRLRAALPDVRSVLMDVATSTAYRGLAVTEPVPFRGAIGYLTAEEHRALAMLRTGDLRLEQERLPADAIRQALMSV